MANKNKNNNIFSENDALDINELASLNDDISPEFIEQLQSQIEQNASEFTGKFQKNEKDDSELFEEIPNNEESSEDKNVLNENIDDNFMKKYKAKLNNQQAKEDEDKVSLSKAVTPTTEDIDNTESSSKETKSKSKKIQVPTEQVNEEIENLTSGNIIEKPVKQEQLDYNESLDFLDDNIKYSKYVIYIDPENTEFMESLTVKERKNLINRIIREQDDIALTKRRFRIVQTVIKHLVVGIVTLTISIPMIYWAINASLEASIDNYRRSQTVFKTLYREKGKIRTQK